MATAPHSAPDYDRHLIQNNGRWMIKSVCRKCHCALIGSMNEPPLLPEVEAAHTIECQQIGQRRQPQIQPAPSDRERAG